MSSENIKEKFSKASRIERFQELIKIKTISYNDPEKIDFAVFKQFENTLAQLYPSIHAACEKTHHGPTGLLFQLKGREAGAPIVLMSHYDVVPVNEELWTVPAFDALIKEDAIWGRGTLDTKGTLLPSWNQWKKISIKGLYRKTISIFLFQETKKYQAIQHRASFVI